MGGFGWQWVAAGPSVSTYSPLPLTTCHCPTFGPRAGRGIKSRISLCTRAIRCVLCTLTGGQLVHLARGSRLIDSPGRDVGSDMKFRIFPYMVSMARTVTDPNCHPCCSAARGGCQSCPPGHPFLWSCGIRTHGRRITTLSQVLQLDREGKAPRWGFLGLGI